jgi:hypothetical protein
LPLAHIDYIGLRQCVRLVTTLGGEDTERINTARTNQSGLVAVVVLELLERMLLAQQSKIAAAIA